MKGSKKHFKVSGFVSFIVVTMLVMVMSVLTASASESKVYKARLSYHWGPKHMSAIMANKFAEECKKATNGRLDIEVFPSGQLFNIKQILPAVSQGSVEMGGVVGVLFMRGDNNFYMLGLQRFFNGFQQKRDFWEKTPAGKKVWEGFQKKLGFKILSYIPVGPCCYFSSKQLDSISAFKGLKARYLIATEKASFKVLGTKYVGVSTAEVYTALKTGMIDTVSTVPSAIKAYSWWDYLKYAQLPYTLYADAYITVNTKWWDTLPKEIQDIVLNDVGPRISKEATDSVMDFSDNILKELVEKHGGTVSPLPEAEIKKLKELDKTIIWPEIAKKIDPALYEAAKKFTGNE